MWIGLQITVRWAGVRDRAADHGRRLRGSNPYPDPNPNPNRNPNPTPKPNQAAAFEGDDTPQGWRHGPAIALGLLPSISAWSWSRIERVFEATRG